MKLSSSLILCCNHLMNPKPSFVHLILQVEILLLKVSPFLSIVVVQGYYAFTRLSGIHRFELQNTLTKPFLKERK